MPQQQAGYKAAILFLSPRKITLQRGTGPYKGQGEGYENRQCIYHTFTFQRQTTLIIIILGHQTSAASQNAKETWG